MRGYAAFALVLAVAVSVPAHGQRPIIDIRKVQTIVDPDGKGFARAPNLIVPIARGQFALQETNTLPVVIDSTGRLVKRFVRGEGPGEFRFAATSLAVGPGDTLYAGNQGSVNVFGPNMKFVRSFPLTSLFGGAVVPVRSGFAVSAMKDDPPGHVTSVHVVNASGGLVRSFVRDTFDKRSGPRPGYRVATASDGNLWVVGYKTHRVEKWSMAGTRLMSADTAHKWFNTKRPAADGEPFVLAAREGDGVLWVMSNIPVADYKPRMEAVFKGRGKEIDGRLIPIEQLFTSHLAAYDARSGKLLGDISVGAYGVTLLDGHRLMVYTPGRNDEAQLEIWEMKLKR